MIIALLTDFGTKDYFVGAMKGAILSINRKAKIIDITHEILPHDIKSAAFTLQACYKNFPEKTIFVAVVDPGVGSNRKAIVVETKRYFFVAPDNGLLSFIFDEEADFSVFELAGKEYSAAEISRTFHGRDVFAPAAAHLSNGVEPREFGREIDDFVRFETIAPHTVSDEKIEAEIIHVDCFGNLITNLKTKDLPENFFIKINGNKIDKLRNFYAEAETGEVFMIAGSAGFLEIAARQDSASKLLNATIGARISLSIIKPKKSA
ncbi:MAG TPA: SAM-dependent chlorinase/fluorinase [Pyrinomonadaceae bacterium]|jgi:S-adenosylmethionine hydrolase